MGCGIQKERYEGLEAVGWGRQNGTDVNYIKGREPTDPSH